MISAGKNFVNTHDPQLILKNKGYVNDLIGDRQGPVEFQPELWPYDETGDDGDGQNAATSAASSPSSSDDDQDDSDPLLNAEWESVANGPGLPSDLATAQHTNSTSSGSADTSAQPPITNSVVGGVVSSVASLWKAWPWTK